MASASARALLLAALSSSLAACQVGQRAYNIMFDPGADLRAMNARDAAQEKEQRRAKADGTCDTAELCAAQCTDFERPIDCVRAGYAYANGQEVHHRERWRKDGSECVHVPSECARLGYAHEDETNETMPMNSQALRAFEIACRGDLAEGCLRAGLLHLRARGQTPGDKNTARPFLTKACALKADRRDTHNTPAQGTPRSGPSSGEAACDRLKTM